MMALVKQNLYNNNNNYNYRPTCKGVDTDLKVGGGPFFTSAASIIFLDLPPHFARTTPLFGGGHFKMWEGPEKFFYTVV